MDSWILKQLRATVQLDLLEFTPENYFESEIEELKFSSSFQGHELLSYNMTWGLLAVKLGRKLHSKTPAAFTARQVSASELLMMLGLLASSEAILNVAEQTSKKALLNEVSDGNSGNVAIQIKTEHVPIFRENISGALEQYLQYLSFAEKKPYISLLPESKQKEILNMAQENSKVITNTVTIVDSDNVSVQAGEHNENNQPNSIIENSVIKWVANHIVTLLITIIGGVIIFKLTIG